MPKPLTQEYLDATLKGSVQDIIGHFNKSQGGQNKRLDAIDTTLTAHTETLAEIKTTVTAIMEQLALRQELQNLVRELKTHGIPIDSSKVFVAPGPRA